LHAIRQRARGENHHGTPQDFFGANTRRKKFFAGTASRKYAGTKETTLPCIAIRQRARLLSHLLSPQNHPPLPNLKTCRRHLCSPESAKLFSPASVGTPVFHSSARFTGPQRIFSTGRNESIKRPTGYHESHFYRDAKTNFSGWAGSRNPPPPEAAVPSARAPAPAPVCLSTGALVIVACLLLHPRDFSYVSRSGQKSKPPIYAWSPRVERVGEFRTFWR
jgi:hypothetical protein